MKTQERIDVTIERAAGHFSLVRESLRHEPALHHLPLAYLAELGDAFAVNAPGRDAIGVRVVLDEALKPSEQGSVAMATRRLRLPERRFVIMSGFDPAIPGLRTGSEQLVTVEAPPGDYRLDVHTLLHSPGGYEIYAARCPHRALGRWFRDTRLGDPMPVWLAELCFRSPGRHDPGQRALWQAPRGAFASGELSIDFTATQGLDYLLHLRPWVEGTEVTALDGDGHLAFDAGARVPRCFPDTVKPAKPRPVGDALARALKLGEHGREEPPECATPGQARFWDGVERVVADRFGYREDDDEAPGRPLFDDGLSSFSALPAPPPWTEREIGRVEALHDYVSSRGFEELGSGRLDSAEAWVKEHIHVFAAPDGSAWALAARRHRKAPEISFFSRLRNGAMCRTYASRGLNIPLAKAGIYEFHVAPSRGMAAIHAEHSHRVEKLGGADFHAASLAEFAQAICEHLRRARDATKLF